MIKSERTSRRVSRIASRLLKSKKTSSDVKAVAASALTQTRNKTKK